MTARVEGDMTIIGYVVIEWDKNHFVPSPAQYVTRDLAERIARQRNETVLDLSTRYGIAEVRELEHE